MNSPGAYGTPLVLYQNIWLHWKLYIYITWYNHRSSCLTANIPTVLEQGYHKNQCLFNW